MPRVPKTSNASSAATRPDIREKGDEVVPKSVRMLFAEAAVNTVSFEMMTVAPSESTTETALKVMPPV
jgi:hypothetical protein